MPTLLRDVGMAPNFPAVRVAERRAWLGRFYDPSGIGPHSRSNRWYRCAQPPAGFCHPLGMFSPDPDQGISRPVTTICWPRGIGETHA